MPNSPMPGALMNTYNRIPLAFVRGEGIYLFDKEGKRYIDAISGIGVCALGHAHPAVTRAICEQAGKLLHTSNLFQIEVQQQLAERLCRLSGMENSFFCNSGAEANEAAIKIARLYGHKKGITNPAILVFDTSFHGRTLATLSASGNRKIQAGFEPLVKGFVRAPFNDIEAVRTIVKNNNDLVAILVEPIQGEGGVYIADESFMNELREITTQKDLLLMLDEVQTGNGRTGRYFAYQHLGWLPDVVTTAKGLANGVPIGACLAQGKAATVFQPGNHGSTFGGNLLACAAALATVTTIEEGGYIGNAACMGEQFLTQFRQKLGSHPAVKAVRGKGLMIGIELSRDCPELVGKAMEKGLLLNVTSGNVIRLLPPLITNPQQADEIIAITCSLLESFTG